MKITYAGDDYWEVEHDELNFTVRRHGGYGPDYTIDQDYFGHEEGIMKQLGMSYEELFEKMDELIKENENE